MRVSKCQTCGEKILAVKEKDSDDRYVLLDWPPTKLITIADNKVFGEVEGFVRHVCKERTSGNRRT